MPLASRSGRGAEAGRSGWAGASRIVFTCETPGRTVAELMERFFDARSNGSRDIQAERVGPDSAEERNSDPDGRSDLFATAPSGRTLISLSLLDFSHRRIRITSSPVKHQTARCYDELGKFRLVNSQIRHNEVLIFPDIFPLARAAILQSGPR